jgi:hypothetical protein
MALPLIQQAQNRSEHIGPKTYPLKMKNSIRASAGILAIIILSITSLRASAQKTSDFSGDWKVDTAKTNYGAFGLASTPVEMKISKTADTITIERIAKSRAGDLHSYTEKLPFDGKIVLTMNHTTKKLASINAGQRSIIETAAYRDDTFDKTYKATETWSISADGKTLTIDRTDDGDDGHSVSKMVYNRR